MEEQKTGAPEGAPEDENKDGISAGEGIDIPQEPPVDPTMSTDIPQDAERIAQAEEQLAKIEEQFAAYMKNLEEQLDAAVKSGKLMPELREVILASERMKMDQDVLSRRAVVQLSYQAFWQFVQTCFEANTLLSGGKIKVVRVDPNPYSETVDIVFCHDQLEKVPEGGMPPLVKMPPVVFNDFQMMMAIRQRNATLMQSVLRAAGWDVTVQDGKSKIIVPPSGFNPRS